MAYLRKEKNCKPRNQKLIGSLAEYKNCNLEGICQVEFVQYNKSNNVAIVVGNSVKNQI